MYTKSAKYKYRGHRFDGIPLLLSAQNDALTSPTDTYLYKSTVNKPPLLDIPNSMLQYYNQNTNTTFYTPQQQTSNTSLPADGKIDNPPPAANNDSKRNTTFAQGLDAVGQLYAPYATVTNTSNQIGNAVAKRAAQGKGLWAEKYAELATPAEGITAEAAAENATGTIASEVGGYVAPALVAMEAGRQIWQGVDKDLSGSAFDKEAANRATWNYDSKNPLLNDPLNTAASLTANNYKDYINSLDKVNFDSNATNTRSLGKEWENNQMINLKESDLKRGVGRSILDNVVSTGKGAMMGLAATGGNWVGALAGGIVGTAADIYNKIRGQANKDEILDAAKEANQKMYQQALNRRNIIAEMNNRRDMINYSALGGKLFADGGEMLNQFETGGSHEENPYGGILQGIAPDGQPNLVEQGETKWNNYIFSKKLKVNKRLAKEYNLPDEFIGKTFADATEKWGDKFKEYENDAKAIATQNAIFSRTSKAQEALRANKMMKQLNEQMANLTPEEQQNLLMQIQQQPMETQQMQYPMGSENMQGGIPQGYALGGHLFAGITPDIMEALRQGRYNRYPNAQTLLYTPPSQDVVNWLYNLRQTDPEAYEYYTGRDMSYKYRFNPQGSKPVLLNQPTLNATALKEVPEGLQDPIVITSTPEENVQVANTAVDWATLSKNKPTYGNWTVDTPQPENAHEQMFAKALNEYWQKRYDDAKTAEDYKKIAEDYNKYQNLYAEIAQKAGNKEWMESPAGQEAIKKLQSQWRTFSHNGNKRGLNTNVTKELMEGIFQTNNKNTTSSPDDLNPKDLERGVQTIVDPDGLWGVQTAARYMGITDPELLKKLEAVGITQREYAPGAWFNRLSYVEPAPQNADNSQTPSEEKKEDTSTEGVRETPDLLPTWMRGVGAVLPFAFLNQKSDYSNADMIRAPKIGFNPVADYLKYRPLDKQYYINTMNASQQNLRNNIVNLSGGNRAAAMNNLMLADLQAQNTLGDLYRKAEEYNADQRSKVATQNAGINEFNSTGFYNADQWNAQTDYDALNKRAQMRHNIDVATAQANGANLTQGINNLIGIGDENARLNMINSNPAYSAGFDPNFAVAFKKWIDDNTKGTNAKRGGYLTIKKRK